MLYAAFTFWLMIVVFAAWGVQRLWTGMVAPRVFNAVLLPGTLVAQIGHVIGCLITGGTVNNTTLYADSDGEPETTTDARPRIPLVGSVVIGLLPLVACAIAVYVVAKAWGGRVLSGMSGKEVATALPTSLAAFWALLRDQVTIVEQLVNAVMTALPGTWQIWVFLYLLVCLTVRMAPFPGTQRGSLGAILLIGLFFAVLGFVTAGSAHLISAGWGILSLTVATLLLLLLISLVVRGGVELGKIVRNRG